MRAVGQRAPKFNHRIVVVFLGWFHSFQQLRYSYTLIMVNITKYNEFCVKGEALSDNEKTVAQRSYKKAQGNELGHGLDRGCDARPERPR